MNKENGVLILGASGLIGRYLYKLLKEENWKVVGTYNSNPKEDMIYFDLINSSLNKIDLTGIKYCIISSALTHIDKCKENPEYSNEVNVKGIKKTIKEAYENGLIPVFLSSASVFDGEKGGYIEEVKK